MRRAVFAAIAIAGLAVPGVASAQAALADTNAPAQGGAQTDTENRLPWRTTSLLFDQSATVETFDRPATLTYDPTYEWWFSFRPRWYFNDHLSFRGRMDLFLELTNSDTTRTEHEPVFGDIWTDLVYTPGRQSSLWNLEPSIGVRALWGTSLESRGNTTPVTLGLTWGVRRTFDHALGLQNIHVGYSGYLGHPFSQYTDASSSSAYPCALPDGIAGGGGGQIFCNQNGGSPLPNWKLYSIFDTGAQITEALSLTLDYILIDVWDYAPTAAVVAGMPVAASANDTRLNEAGWFLASLDLDATKWLALGVGYYNLHNVLSASSTYINPLYYYGARAFFDVTVTFDELYRSFGTSSVRASEAARAARQNMILNNQF